MSTILKTFHLVKTINVLSLVKFAMATFLESILILDVSHVVVRGRIVFRYHWLNHIKLLSMFKNGELAESGLWRRS
jgi:hypothetical protein